MGRAACCRVSPSAKLSSGLWGRSPPLPRRRTCSALTLQYRKPAKQATTSMYFLALATSIFSVDTMPADDSAHTATALVVSWSNRMKLGVGMNVTHTCARTRDSVSGGRPQTVAHGRNAVAPAA